MIKIESVPLTEQECEMLVEIWEYARGFCGGTKKLEEWYQILEKDKTIGNAQHIKDTKRIVEGSEAWLKHYREGLFKSVKKLQEYYKTDQEGD